MCWHQRESGDISGGIGGNGINGGARCS